MFDINKNLSSFIMEKRNEEDERREIEREIEETQEHERIEREMVRRF